MQEVQEEHEVVALTEATNCVTVCWTRRGVGGGGRLYSITCHVSGVRCQVSGARCQVSCVR